MKVALVTDWLTSRGGAEEVVLDMLEVYPDAHIYTSVFKPKNFPELKDKKVITSFIQKLPLLNRKHQIAISLMPLAFENFDLSSYDMIISSSVACSKGVITKPETLHVSYCHTPMRFVWNDCHNYIKNFPLPNFIKKLATNQLHKLRMWDYLASQRVDQFFANSENVRKRIKKYYKQDSIVIHPGTKISSKNHPKPKESNYYIAVGRLISYKRFDLIIKAFNQNKKNLIIIGDGNMTKKLHKLNTNPNTKFLGFVDNETKNQYLQHANALIFPQEEDFGITPLEAQSFGTPVIALDKGGAKETVSDQTGVFFQNQTTQDLNQAIQEFEVRKFNKNIIKEHAKTFSKQIFQNKLKSNLEKAYAKHKKEMA